MKNSRWLGVLVAGGYYGLCSANPVTQDDLNVCLTQPSDAERLVCYKNLTKNILQPELKQQAKQAKQADGPAAAGTAASDKSSHITRKVILDHEEPSYLTLSSGLRLGSDRSTSNLIYEAQLIQNLPVPLSSVKTPEIASDSGPFWIDLPVRIVVRQVTDTSKPVRTPSFNPGLRLTYATQSRTSPFFSSSYYSLGAYHYSNGQDGDGVQGDGKINTRNGSFNTNYVEFIGSWLNPKDRQAVQWAQIAFRQHFYGTFESVQRDQYPRRTLSLALHSREYELGGEKFQFRLMETVGFNYRYVVKNEVTPSLDVKARPSDRLNTRVELLYQWDVSKLGLYARYDYGYDYYNINFQRRINRFQIGVMALSR